MLTKRLVFLLIVCALVFSVSTRVEAKEPAPLLGADSPTAIAGQYIVVFKPGTPGGQVNAAAEHSRSQGGIVLHSYSTALTGFAARLPERALQGLRNNPNVEYIEADQIVSLDTSEAAASWGLDRIDQRNLPLNGFYTYNFTGAGVTAYIIDTGIRITHTQFGNRAAYGYDAVDNDQISDDCNGHGTHVAGTVGGNNYGVAKGVNLVAVRVLDCSGSGSTSGVIAGVDWVTANHPANAVANMSLGGSASRSLDNAVTNSINSGVTYTLSAGNSNADACRFSPARTKPAITVGSTTSADNRSGFSNFGKCLDLFAPGSSITSAWNTNDSATNTISGTSMAAPHVAGVAALYLEAHPGAAPSAVASAITSTATANVVGNAGRGSPNLLLYSLIP